MNQVIAREYVDKNYIHKDKIKDKIKELIQQYEKSDNEYMKAKLLYQIKILQEVLGETDDNN